LGGGYRHDEQSLRVVRYLEKAGRGLNLSLEVIDGIRTHRKPRHDLSGVIASASTTLEAEVVKLSDAVAYINHDVDDAIRAHIIAEEDLPPVATSLLGGTRSERINAAVADIVSNSSGQPKVSPGAAVLEALNELRDFLFREVYTGPVVKRESDRAQHVVSELFRYFASHPEAMPDDYQEDPRGEGVPRRVADYIAGMTDLYAIQRFEQLFVPKTWTM
jgi:dGTPase